MEILLRETHKKIPLCKRKFIKKFLLKEDGNDKVIINMLSFNSQFFIIREETFYDIEREELLMLTNFYSFPSRAHTYMESSMKRNRMMI